MSLITTKSRFRFALRATFCVLVLGLASSGLLPAAELSTAFPKEKPPLELAPRLGRPFGDNAVFQQKMPVPVWGWTLPDTDVEVSFDAKKMTIHGWAFEDEPNTELHVPGPSAGLGMLALGAAGIRRSRRQAA